ncbi:MAG: ATPase domain-containing protein [Candidatus Altiarchaeota archaeon]
MDGEQQDKDLVMPVRVSAFDKLINQGGIERGNTILLVGGCGSGKTIFSMQSLYNACLAGEKVVYFTLEESDEKIRRHMKKNFGWDIEEQEAKGLFYLKKIDPYELVKEIELTLVEYRRKDSVSLAEILNTHPEISLIDAKGIELPFHPDRIVIDSVSALYSAFSDKDSYRVCMQLLISALNAHNSVNLIILETEQEPDRYSTFGSEEFIVDGVVTLYNLRRGQLRRRAIEIVKLRHSGHVTDMVPYRIGPEGFTIMVGEKL